MLTVALSASVIVTAAEVAVVMVGVAPPPPPGLLMVTVNVSSPSSKVSATPVTVISPLLAPLLIVKVLVKE